MTQQLEPGRLERELEESLTETLPCRFDAAGEVHREDCSRADGSAGTTTRLEVLSGVLRSCCALRWAEGVFTKDHLFVLGDLLGAASTEEVTSPHDLEVLRGRLEEGVRKVPAFAPWQDALEGHFEELEEPFREWRSEEGAALLDEWASLETWKDRSKNQVEHLVVPGWDTKPRRIGNGGQLGVLSEVVAAGHRLGEHHHERERKAGRVLVRTRRADPSLAFDNAWLTYAAQELVAAPHVMVAPRSMETAIRKAFEASVAVVKEGTSEGDLEVAVQLLSESAITASQALKVARAV
jgi:hypothetical protein